MSKKNKLIIIQHPESNEHFFLCIYNKYRYFSLPNYFVRSSLQNSFSNRNLTDKIRKIFTYSFHEKCPPKKLKTKNKTNQLLNFFHDFRYILRIINDFNF